MEREVVLAVASPMKAFTSNTAVARHRRRALAALFDAMAWAVSIVLAVLLRYEFDFTAVNWSATLSLAFVAATLQVTWGYAFALYRGRFSYGSFDEVRAIALGVLIQALFLSLAVVVFGNAVGVPRSTIFIAFPFVIIFMFGVRYTSRLLLEHRRKPTTDAAPALIVGAGDSG